MKLRNALIAVTAMVSVAATAAKAEEITIATVNNADMITMQELAPAWEKETGNTINWVVLEENVLRQRTTTDIATGGGSFDIMFIGAYEITILRISSSWCVTVYPQAAASTLCRCTLRLRSRSIVKMFLKLLALKCQQSK